MIGDAEHRSDARPVVPRCGQNATSCQWAALTSRLILSVMQTARCCSAQCSLRRRFTSSICLIRMRCQGMAQLFRLPCNLHRRCQDVAHTPIQQAFAALPKGGGAVDCAGCRLDAAFIVATHQRASFLGVGRPISILWLPCKTVIASLIRPLRP